MSESRKRPASLYMSSPINALLEGFYSDEITIASLKEKGDFGIGTFNQLDGELIALDGAFYQLDLNGDAHPVRDDLKTPFATVCRFAPMFTESFPRPLSSEAFTRQLETMLPSENMFYALRMEGTFDEVKTRSVPRTENYRPLSEATDHQRVRTFNDVTGTLVGFYTPSFMPSVNVPGYHFHFIDQARSAGGHVLRVAPRTLMVHLQLFFSMELSLPKTLDYLTAEFARDARSDLDKAEKE